MLISHIDNKNYLTQRLRKQTNHSNYELEYQIRELFHEAYDSVFHKILQVDLYCFIQLVIDQVKTTFELIYSKRTDSNPFLMEIMQSNEVYIAYLFKSHNKIISKHFEKYNAMAPSFNFLKRFRKHCPQTSTFAFHLCHEKDTINYSMLIELSLYNKEITHVMCTYCKAIYSAQEIKLHCTKCNVNYYSSILHENDNINLLPSTWLTYHCKRQKIEKMKCIKCFYVLYYDLKKLKLICINPRCNFCADPLSLIWKCSLCQFEFESNAKIYNPLKGLKYQKAIRIALILLQKAFPIINCCESKEIKQINYYHNKYCKGQLYLGAVNRKKAVVCDKCKVIFDYETFIWTCPECNKHFSCDNSCVTYVNDKPYFKKINRKSSENDFNNEDHDFIPFSPKTIQPLSLFELTLKNSREKHNNDKDKINSFKKQDDNHNFELIGQKKSINTKQIKEIDEQCQEEEEKRVIFQDDDDEEYQYDYLKQIQMIIKEKEHVVDIGSVVPNFDLNQYKTIKKIGQGSYAIIFEVVDKATKLHYAMKKVIANDISELKKYQLEYEMIYIHPHPHIIQIFGFTYKKLDFSTYSVFILLEFADCDWDTQITIYHQGNQNYSEDSILIIMKQLTSAFSFLQSSKITHRDIKPPNILVFSNNIYKVSDFGEAKYVRKDKDMNTLKGTEMFMSPDKYKALYHNELKTMNNTYKSDMFSFGLCFIYALTLDYVLIDNLQKQKDCTDYIDKLNLSSYLTNILKKMIIDENERYDFISIEKVLQNDK